MYTTLPRRWPVSNAENARMPRLTFPVQRLPRWIFLQSLSNPTYFLLRPVILIVKIDSEGQTIVDVPFLNVYGAGFDEAEALADFEGMLISTFEELASSENVLSEPLRRQLQTIKVVVGRT